MKYPFNIYCVFIAAFAVILFNSCSSLKADFSYWSMTDKVPCTVYFTNLSKGASSYYWDFGDGTSSTETGPTHIYTTAGSITVSLSAYSGLAFDEKQIIIELSNPPASTVNDLDGNSYPTVQIGNQTWMASNLKSTHYQNGDPIPLVTDNMEWDTLMLSSIGAYCEYDNTSWYTLAYGNLYNYYAVVDGRNLCPLGTHVPSDAEWSTLGTYLGGDNIAGGALKDTGTVYWTSPNIGATNSSGFTGLPGGYRLYDGSYSSMHTYGYWWTSTSYDSSYAWFRSLINTYESLNPSNLSKISGMSVRCVKD